MFWEKKEKKSSDEALENSPWQTTNKKARLERTPLRAPIYVGDEEVDNALKTLGINAKAKREIDKKTA